MNRKLVTGILVFVFLLVGLLIMWFVNGFADAKWFDGGMDLIYGVIIIYLAVLLYSSYNVGGNKNIFYVALGFFIIVGDRILQILLQEIHLKTNYELAILPWSWAFADFFMILGFFFIIKGLWRVGDG
jgi:hypothetical protein